MRGSLLLLLLPVLAALGGPRSVWAHATLDRTNATADGINRLVISVNHGCDGQPTLRVRVRMPKGVLSVGPEQKRGWDVVVKKEKLPQPIKLTQGEVITETVSEVMWSGMLAHDQTDEFVMNLRLPNRPGETIYFPTVQECPSGVQRWIEIPAAGKSPADYAFPAPSLTLKPRPPNQ